MPKLPTENIHVRTEADGGVKVACRAHVNTEGKFYLEIPEPYFPTFIAFTRELSNGVYQDDEIGRIDFTGLELHGHIGERIAFKQGASHSDYQKLIKFFRLAVAFHFKAEKTVEKVLIYTYDSGLSYWKNKDGTITANGACKGAKENGSWAGNRNIHATHREKNGLTLRAYCLVKTTHKRGDSEVVEFEQYRDEQTVETFGGLINFMSPGTCPTGERYHNGEFPGWTLIPYTEKAAEFFYKTLHGLCRIDDSLRQFFGDTERVTASIESGQLPLLK